MKRSAGLVLSLMALILSAGAEIRFQRPDTITAGSELSRVALADFNNDGHLDMVVTDLKGKILVFLGNGSGAFRRLAANASLAFPKAVATGDFNGDGAVDLVISNQGDNTVAILLGNGDGTFQAPTVQGSGDGELAVGDFNGDHILDFAVSGTFNFSVNVYLGNGDGTFHESASISGLLGTPLVIADFNRDGKADLAVPQILFLGNGDGTFQKGRLYSGGSENLAAGDFNGDGLLDIASSDDFSGRLYLAIGNGDGSFSADFSRNTETTIGSLAAGDFNNDGLADVVTGGSSDNNTITVWGGKGDGTLAAPITTLAARSPAALAAGDFNSDGNLDLAVISAAGQIAILLGQGNRTFNAPRAYLVPEVSQIISADFNGDGRPDIAASAFNEDGVVVMLGSTTGLGPQVTYALSTEAGALAAGDVNNDGKMDLLCADEAGTGVSVLLGNGDGTFQSPLFYSEVESNTSLVLADVNHDGNLDLINTFGWLEVALGNGDGTFQHRTRLNEDNLNAVAVADLDGDGNVDVVGADGDFLGVAVFIGAGDGTFTESNIGIGLSPTSVAIADFNRDGNPDIIALDPNLGITVFLGNGDGTFEAGVGFNPGVNVQSQVIAADFDGDGNVDFAVNTGFSILSVFPGKGDGSFGAPIQFLVNDSTASLAIADFNVDGKPDVASAGGVVNGTVQILLNTSP